MTELKEELIEVTETVRVYSKGPFACRFDALTDVRDMEFPRDVPPRGTASTCSRSGTSGSGGHSPDPTKDFNPDHPTKSLNLEGVTP